MPNLDIRKDIKSFTGKPVFKKDKKSGKLKLARVKGHIPGAKVFPNELLTGAEAPVAFAAPEEIKHMANELGIDASSDMITYCNSGQLASGSWFVFSELLGNKNVRLYDGSMHQWALEKRPVKTMIME